jgi:hypothetical protein
MFMLSKWYQNVSWIEKLEIGLIKIYKNNDEKMKKKYVYEWLMNNYFYLIYFIEKFKKVVDCVLIGPSNNFG